MTSIEDTIRRIVREELRAALEEWRPPAPASSPVAAVPWQPLPRTDEQRAGVIRPLTRAAWWLAIPPAERPEWGPIPEYLGTAAAAEALEVSVSRLAAWRSEGIGPKWKKFGRLVNYTREDLDQWLREHGQEQGQGGDQRR